MKSLTNLLKSKVLINEKKSFIDNAIGVFTKDPVSVMKLFEEIRTFPSRIRDEIYWENFETYLFHVYDYDKEKSILVNKNKKELSVLLAEATPNQDADYPGNPEHLREGAKRLVKLLDDAGTKQKSVYYANLTRAALNDYITRDKFFKLCKCISELTEEDICRFISHIQKTGTNTIKDDFDFIDDFRSVGLLKEVYGGFAYTNRAFELLKYGFKYEEDVKIPDGIQERMMVGPGRMGGIDDMLKDGEEILTVKVH